MVKGVKIGGSVGGFWMLSDSREFFYLSWCGPYGPCFVANMSQIIGLLKVGSWG